MPPILADVAINSHPKEKRDRRLIRALVRSRGRRDDANVEEEPEGRGGDDNSRDGLIDVPQVSRHPITEKQERDLEHDGEGFHRDAVPMPTSLYQRPAHFDLTVPVELLFFKHGEASGENRYRELGIHRALDADVAGVREFPNKRRGSACSSNAVALAF